MSTSTGETNAQDDHSTQRDRSMRCLRGAPSSPSRAVLDLRPRTSKTTASWFSSSDFSRTLIRAALHSSGCAKRSIRSCTGDPPQGRPSQGSSRT